MVHEFRLPDVGEGVAEGELVAWLVGVGDAVSEDQPVAEVETDKALVELPSPVDGTVRELRAEEGEIIPVGDVFITFDVAGAGAEPAEGGAGSAAAEATSEPTAGRVFAPPSVRRLARELDVDLAAVSGSGPSGRITGDDVRAAAGGGEERPAGAEPADGPTTETSSVHSTGPAVAGDEARREKTLAAPATRRLAEELGVDIDAVPPAEERDGEAFVTPEAVRAFAEAGGVTATPAEAGADAPPAGGEERVPYRGLRRTIGERMVRSAFTIPHVSHHELLDGKPLVDAREALKGPAAERGIRLTYLPFVMRAVTGALAEFPSLNASLDEEAGEIVMKGEYNIGFAVATDDGLLVPVVQGADGKGLLQLASEVTELAEKARDRSIAREEMQGGTFTITNFGAVGGDYGTPIINHPEVAILGLGAIEPRPYVIEGEVVARQTLPISLSIDHRVIDGAEAAAFAGRLAEALENPLRLLLD